MTDPGRTPRERSLQIPAPLAAIILLGGVAIIWASFKPPAPASEAQPARSEALPARPVERRPVRAVPPRRSTDRFSRQNAPPLFDPPNRRTDTVWEDAIRLFPEAFGIELPDDCLDEMLLHLSAPASGVEEDDS